jgi:NADPH:quinone reductase-like Zn-dependent oxidoreductase
VNPSDVKNVEGQMERTVLPRVPGRDFSGASRPEVWGTGFTLDGSHAELIAIPGPALSRKPSRAAKGEDVVIVGVSGGVGGAVAQLARALDAAHVIGIDRRRRAEGSPAASRIDAYEAADRDGEASVRMRLIGGGRRT